MWILHVHTIHFFWNVQTAEVCAQNLSPWNCEKYEEKVEGNRLRRNELRMCETLFKYIYIHTVYIYVTYYWDWWVDFTTLLYDYICSHAFPEFHQDCSHCINPCYTWHLVSSQRGAVVPQCHPPPGAPAEDAPVASLHLPTYPHFPGLAAGFLGLRIVWDWVWGNLYVLLKFCLVTLW